MTGAIIICGTPLPSNLTADQRAEKCRCGHPRSEHWFGGGDCGDCSDRQRKRPCQYFRIREENRRPPTTETP